jgi:hypothetical protein
MIVPHGFVSRRSSCGMMAIRRRHWRVDVWFAMTPQANWILADADRVLFCPTSRRVSPSSSGQYARELSALTAFPRVPERGRWGQYQSPADDLASCFAITRFRRHEQPRLG